MNAPNAKPVTAYPNFLKSLLAGFDRISRYAWLALFPVAVDVLLWFGPRLPMKSLIQTLSQQMLAASRLGLAQDSELARANRQMWSMLAERFNLTIALRSYPVGIPSLMSGRMPVESPLGQSVAWEVNNIVAALGVWLAISVIGLILGTLFYQLVSQVALDGKAQWRVALLTWPKSFLRVLGVSTSLVVLYMLVTLPASCLLLMSALSGIAQCIFFLYAGFLAWLLFPFFLAGHGIFVNGDSTSASVMRGARITRLLIIPTSLLFLAILLLTQGLDMLWNVTAENSWLSFVGIVGHAFVTTALLAGTFVYYKDADQWVRNL